MISITSSGTRHAVAAIAGLLGLLALGPAASQDRPVPDSYTATTAAMSPAGVGLRINVVSWSDEEARAAAVAALQSGDGIEAALAELATAGYVWLDGSSVGYAIKYAHRTPAADDGERVTIVTGTPVGAHDLEPWTANEPAADSPTDYSVIELYLDSDGRGIGTLSYAASVSLDGETGQVALDRGERAPVLNDATRVPKPYWADGS